MTPEQQRIALAKAFGYEIFIDDSHPNSYRLQRGESFHSIFLDSEQECWNLSPDTTDLNVLHEAWKQLILPDKDKHKEFRWNLQIICLRDKEKLGWQSVSNATAEQRLEAIIRTLNLFE